MSKQNSTEHDGCADFDFFIGRWKQQHRLLREQLQGSNDWEEAGGQLVVRKILGGLGISKKVRWNAHRGSCRS